MGNLGFPSRIYHMAAQKKIDFIIKIKTDKKLAQRNQNYRSKYKQY